MSRHKYKEKGWFSSSHGGEQWVFLNANCALGINIVRLSAVRAQSPTYQPLKLSRQALHNSSVPFSESLVSSRALKRGERFGSNWSSAAR